MKVLIADDEPLARERLARLVSALPGYQVLPDMASRTPGCLPVRWLSNNYGSPMQRVAGHSHAWPGWLASGRKAL